MIDNFRDEYSFLSNFYLCKIEMDGLTYRSVEHAYQAAKTLDINERLEIQKYKSPVDAKRKGKLLLLRPDWDVIKLDTMYDLLKKKFQYNYLRKMLLNTGNEILIERNYWGDRYWGVYEGKGLNHLGRLLMRIRNEYANISSIS